MARLYGRPSNEFPYLDGPLHPRDIPNTDGYRLTLVLIDGMRITATVRRQPTGPDGNKENALHYLEDGTGQRIAFDTVAGWFSFKPLT